METIQFLGEVKVSLGNINIDQILNEFPELKSYLEEFTRTKNGAFISAVSFKASKDGYIDFSTFNSKFFPLLQCSFTCFCSFFDYFFCIFCCIKL